MSCKARCGVVKYVGNVVEGLFGGFSGAFAFDGAVSICQTIVQELVK